MTTVVDRWNIHPDHRWLRGERADKTVQFDEAMKVWNVYGYSEIHEILGNHAVFSSNTARVMPVSVEESLIEGDMSQMDPPRHRKFRQLVNHAFTPKVVAAMEPRVQAITAELVDALDGRDQVELVADLTYPLPVIVIAELLGVPASDRDLFRGWADKVIEGFSGFSFLDGSEQGEADLKAATEQIKPLLNYLADHVADRRRKPRNDLLSRLAAATVDGERLTSNEIVNVANILLVTGHITTTMLLGNTLLCLDAYPEQAIRVRADRSLVPGAIEEALRLLPPSTALTRATNADAEVGGELIPRDQLLMLWLGAANRDPAQFRDPGEYEPGRDPNPHFGFGRGIHFCVGAGLTRLEGRVALNALLDRFPNLHATRDNPPTFFSTPDMIGVKSLPLHTA